jgi:hypothetical protein
MYFLINTNDNISRVLVKGESTSLSAFKLNNPEGPTSEGTYEYVEIPTEVYTSLRGSTGGLFSIDGTTGGLGGPTASVGGATSSYLYDDLSSLNMQEPSTDIALTLGQLPSDFATTALNLGVYNSHKNIAKSEIDPRLHPDITLAQTQTIKELESENSFLDEGLGATASISFEKDDGASQSLVFDNRRDTILDLLTIKQYSDLNLSIVNQSSQTSVVVTGIKIIDNEGTITSLSPTEFDKCLHAVLAEFYENYIARTDMKNIVKNPVGTTDAEKIAYLQDSTNLAFSVSLNSSFAQAASGK